MGDRVAVMRKGELQQVDEPQTLYDRPVNLFVGGFIGSPAMNMLEATIERSNGGVASKMGETRIALSQELLARRRGLESFVGRNVVIGIRPEDLADSSLERDAPADQRLRGTVQLREALGSEIMVHLAVDARQAMTEDVRELAEDVGVEAVGVTEHDGATIVGRFSPRSRVKVGDTVDAVVDTRSLHFFDPETGLGIYDMPAKGEAS